MKKLSTLLSIAGAAASMVLAEPALASTQGSFGATSTGSLSINASVPGRVRISGLSDVTFSNVDPSVNATDAQNVCVWSNTSTRGYSITATGSGAANAFTLSSGALPVVPYTVEWAQTTGQASGEVLKLADGVDFMVSELRTLVESIRNSAGDAATLATQISASTQQMSASTHVSPLAMAISRARSACESASVTRPSRPSATTSANSGSTAKRGTPSRSAILMA